MKHAIHTIWGDAVPDKLPGLHPSHPDNHTTPSTTFIVAFISDLIGCVLRAKEADSLREGFEETLTVHRLKPPGLLRQTLSSTDNMESANSGCMGIIRRVCSFKNAR